nr:MAG TPA: hypothetical protein [Caudoviricetes sp.]
MTVGTTTEAAPVFSLYPPPVGGCKSLQPLCSATGVGVRVQNRSFKGGIKQGPIRR